MNELLNYAIRRRDEAVSNGTIGDILYWNGYIDGIKAVRRSVEDAEN